MEKYKDDMSQEKKPAGLLPEGERLVRVTEMIASVSKGGNKMFTTTIEDIKTKKTMTVWLVNEPKKRWMLKSLLNACNVAGGQDGVYEWNTLDVIGKTVVAMVEHYKEDWINKEGVTVKLDKAKVTDFLNAPQQQEEEIAWKE